MNIHAWAIFAVPVSIFNPIIACVCVFSITMLCPIVPALALLLTVIKKPVELVPAILHPQASQGQVYPVYPVAPIDPCGQVYPVGQVDPAPAGQV
jgi:hypothetical protein